MPSATPIRLVQDNGNLIELDATSMTLTTTRKVGGSPLPFSGSQRFGIDMNLNQAMINIQGVIADDREGTKNVSSFSTINFGKTKIGEQFATTTNLTALADYKLRLRSFAGVDREITFTNLGSGTTAASYSGTIISYYTESTSLSFATAVEDCINANFSADFSAVRVQDYNYADYYNYYSVKITMVTAGTKENSTPVFLPVNPARVFNSCMIVPFKGGKTGGKKSAGDKAMDLYGVLNNSVTQTGRNVLGGSLLIGGLLAAPATGGLSLFGSLGGITLLSADEEMQDYIIGIQIPYNSSIQADDGELYTARNFFMPTGLFHKGLEKTSDENTRPAGVKFDAGNDYTGIQGAIQKMDIEYDAGESVYTFNMIFAPIDTLI